MLFSLFYPRFGQQCQPSGRPAGIFITCTCPSRIPAQIQAFFSSWVRSDLFNFGRQLVARWPGTILEVLIRLVRIPGQFAASPQHVHATNQPNLGKRDSFPFHLLQSWFSRLECTLIFKPLGRGPRTLLRPARVTYLKSKHSQDSNHRSSRQSVVR